ncbi:MAG: orotidine-5'-phosphate decarboxylase [Deltaproteobacteria bacterium]|nr:orotidine-5'-phosphate decarboxylase [Deltaproteobacteria bacterium]
MIAKQIRNSKNPSDHLVFPLDVPNSEMAVALADELKGRVGFFKVGLELFVAHGPALIDVLREKDPSARFFLDLKLHDIPATVGRAIAAARDLKVDLVTVHAQGGVEMMKAAVEAAAGATVLAVTLLTSLDPASLDELTPDYQSRSLYAARLAQRALVAGCGGLVASPLEVTELRARFGREPLLVTPGIRPTWSSVASDDQKRVGTVESALSAGSDLLVVGRPIRDAECRSEAADKILEEIAKTLNL